MKLNKKEKFGIKLFKRNHKCRWNLRRIYWLYFGKGEWFSVKNYGTNIGIATFVHCNACGKKFNITDYDHW